MKLRRNLSLSNDLVWEIRDLFLKHFEYRISNINSYDELTEEEKSFIDRDLFNLIVEN